MPSLHELQARFAAGLHGDAQALDGIVAAGDFSAAERLSVYRNNFRISLTGTLADVYPVVARLVGDGFFGYLADAYLQVHPSRSGNLHAFGHALPEFLEQFEAARELGYLPDVARLEWAWHEAFHAADAAPLDPATLATIPAERHGELVFATHPSLHMLRSDWPVSRIWEANQDGADVDTTIDVDAGAELVGVWRAEGNVVVARMPAADFAMLGALASGVQLGAACEAAEAADTAADVGTALGSLVTGGVLGAARLPGDAG